MTASYASHASQHHTDEEDPYADVSADVDWEWEDWRHNASLAIKLSQVSHWPPRCSEVDSGFSLEAVEAFARRLDCVDETWESHPCDYFDSRPHERSDWLRRRLLA